MKLFLKKAIQLIMKVIGHTLVGIVLLVIVVFELTTRYSKERTFERSLEEKGYSKIELSKPILEVLFSSPCGRFKRYSFSAQKEGKKATGIICESMKGIHIELDKKK